MEMGTVTGKLIPERTLGNQRMYTEQHLTIARNLKTGKFPTKIVIYCRVFSHAQKNDLYSQLDAMDKFCVANGISVTDISGRDRWSIKF
jgi:putative resolvase